MKKYIAILLTFIMIICCLFTACGSDGGSQNQQKSQEKDTAEVVKAMAVINVFADESFEKCLNEIVAVYKTKVPDVTVKVTYGKSSELKEKIQKGADCDIFFPAEQKEMNQLDGTKSKEELNLEGLDMIISDSRMELVENKIVLAAKDKTKAKVKTVKEMASALTSGTVSVVTGNYDVSAGKYAYYIINNGGLYKGEEYKPSNVSYLSSAKDITKNVLEGKSDLCIVYAGDAYNADLDVLEVVTSEYVNRIAAPIAIIKGCKEEETARAFLEYLTTAEVSDIFKKAGLLPVF